MFSSRKSFPVRNCLCDPHVGFRDSLIRCFEEARVRFAHVPSDIGKSCEVESRESYCGAVHVLLWPGKRSECCLPPCRVPAHDFVLKYFQRRCFSLADSASDIILVHYLDVKEMASSNRVLPLPLPVNPFPFDDFEDLLMDPDPGALSSLSDDGLQSLADVMGPSDLFGALSPLRPPPTLHGHTQTHSIVDFAPACGSTSGGYPILVVVAPIGLCSWLHVSMRVCPHGCIG